MIGFQWIKLAGDRRLGQFACLSRQRSLPRLAIRAIKPAAREYFRHWAEDWSKARGNRSAATTTCDWPELADNGLGS